MPSMLMANMRTTGTGAIQKIGGKKKIKKKKTRSVLRLCSPKLCKEKPCSHRARDLLSTTEMSLRNVSLGI